MGKDYEAMNGDQTQTAPWRVRPYRLMVYRDRDERCVAMIPLTKDQASAIGELISPPGDGIGCYELVGLAHFQIEPTDDQPQTTCDDAEVMRVWRECALPEWFLGNGGTNCKLVEFARRLRAAQQPLSEPFSTILHTNLWDLYEQS